jgi:LmbE family N-acetylglucosaminyl deacetylase
MSQWQPSYLNPLFSSVEQALAACTHLAIVAHPDDLEILAGHGICETYQNPRHHFVGIVCTSGGGAPGFNGESSTLIAMREEEQKRAAIMGEYGALFTLALESASIKNQWNDQLGQGLQSIINQSRPQLVYTHSLADRHLTHQAVCLHSVRALRQSGHRPQQFLGCEVWGSLDWLPESVKVSLPISRPELIKDLIRCHRSQVQVKAYDQAVLGRFQSNSVFQDSHNLAVASLVGFAMNLLPLVDDGQLTPAAYLKSLAELFLAQSTLPSYSDGAL